MKEDSISPIEITQASNGFIIRISVPTGYVTSIKDSYVFNDEKDMFKFISDYFGGEEK